MGKIIDELFRVLCGDEDEEETVTMTGMDEDEAPNEPDVKTPEEWIWVTGYKGTDKNMQCHGEYQYELGKQFDMPEDAAIMPCVSGFHMCRDLDDVYRYYSIGRGNRFFEVKALVRKSDYKKYGTIEYIADEDSCFAATRRIEHFKLAAKSIIFTRELDPKEILGVNYDIEDWTEEYTRIALECSVSDAVYRMNVDRLTRLGYSLPFATYIVKHGKFDIAYAVGSQEDMSMDMKALAIFTTGGKR